MELLKSLKYPFYLFLVASMAFHSIAIWELHQPESGNDFSLKGKTKHKAMTRSGVVAEGSQPIALQLIERKKPAVSSSSRLALIGSRPIHHTKKINEVGKTKSAAASTTSTQFSVHSAEFPANPTNPTNSSLDSNDIYYRPSPRYPSEALKQQMEGEVRVEVRTNDAGCVSSIRLEQSTGHSLLDAEALQAVKRWRLTPNSVFHIPFHFKIVGKNENQIDHSNKE